MSEPSNPPPGPAGLSRRQFVAGVALGAAAGGAPAAETPAAPKLSPAAEAQLQAILRLHGDRLSAEEKTDLRRLVAEAQKPAEQLRAFRLENADEPALVFRVYPPPRR
jgi:hypothetical protein